MVNAIPDTLPAIYRRCQKSLDAEKMPSVMLHTAHSPHERVPAPLLLTHIGANPLTGSYFIHHRRRQFVRQSRLSGGGINPRDGFATAHILPFFSAFCLTFPQLFRSRVLWAGKRGMTRLTAIIREDARSGLFLTSCTSWEFLYRGRQEQLSLFNPTNNFEKVKIVLDSTRSSFGFVSRHMHS